MKKITFLTVLIAFLTLWSANTFAKEYDLVICGTKVTDENKNFIVESFNKVIVCKALGKITYDSGTKTLTLDNVNVEYRTGNDHSDPFGWSYHIWSKISGLTIIVKGENTFKTTGAYSGCMRVMGNTTIKGMGELQSKLAFSSYRKDYTDCIVEGCNLTLEDVTLSIEKDILGSSKYYSGYAKGLTIKNASVLCNNIKYFKSITLTNCAVTHGQLIHNEDSGLYSVDNDIAPVQIHTTFPLWVGGRQVHTGNLGTIMGENIGSVRYNHTTKTLRFLGNYTINTRGSTCAVESEIPGLTIDLSGNNVLLQSENGTALMLKGNTTITGNGKLWAESTNWNAIYHTNDLTFSNVSITAKGGNRGICGSNGTQKLNLDNSYVSATGPQGSICNNTLYHINFHATTQPAGAQYLAYLNGVGLNGSLVNTEVIMEPSKSYPLWVAGTQVTTYNKHAIGNNSAVTFNPEYNELTLDNATINCSGAEAIKSDLPYLTILIKGANRLTSTRSRSAIRLNERATIITQDELAASLNITSDSTGILVANGASANISTVQNLNITGERAGIEGLTGNETVNFSTITGKIKGSQIGSVCNLGSVTMASCAILTPAGAAFDAAKKAICSGGSVVKSEISITNADVYDLWVAGVQVTSANCSNITGTNIRGKMVRYAPKTQTLLLDSVTINCGNVPAIDSRIPNLKIDLTNNNKLSSSSSVPTISVNSATFMSNGTLTCEYGSAGIYAKANSEIIIDNTTVIAKGSNYGIRGESNVRLVVRGKNASLTAKGTNSGSISGISEFQIPEDSQITPEGAKWNASSGNVERNGAIVKTDVVIEPINYDIWICDQKLTVHNEPLFLSQFNIWYDESSNTLVLDGGAINLTNLPGVVNAIRSQIENLTIEVRRDYSITNTSGAAYPILLKENTTIKGAGKLTLTNTATSVLGTAINASKNLSIDSTTVIAVGDFAGIFVGSGNLTINYATVKAAGPVYASIYAKTLTLNNAKITKPSGAVFNAAKQAIVDGSGNIVTAEVAIEPTHLIDLWVLDQQVDEAKPKLTGDGITGIVEYRVAQKELHLYNATIDNTTGYDDIALRSEIEGLSITLIGKNKIIGYLDDALPAVMFANNTHISGPGSLEIVNGDGDCIEINNIDDNNVRLTIDGTTLNLESESGSGIVGNTTAENKATLTINEANVSIKGGGTYSYPIRYIDEMSLINVSVVKPEGAYFSETLKGMTVDGTTLVKGELEIVPIKTAIENVKDNQSDAKIFAREGRIFGAENARIYDLLGRDVTRMNGNLKGVFVVKGSSFVEKIIVR